MRGVRLVLIALVTGALGSLAIVSSIVSPRGDAFRALARVWARLVLAVCRVRILVTRHHDGGHHGPCLYVANHQSLLDIPPLILALEGPYRMVAKRELARVPVFGWALRVAGFVFIDRRDRDGAIRSLQAVLDQIRTGISVVMFPEGTRSPDGGLLDFKKGAFVLAIQGGIPIVPVAIRGGHAVLPRGSLRVRPGVIEVRLGQPIDPTPYSLENKEALMQRVRDAIGEGLRVSCVPDAGASPLAPAPGSSQPTRRLRP